MSTILIGTLKNNFMMISSKFIQAGVFFVASNVLSACGSSSVTTVTEAQNDAPAAPNVPAAPGALTVPATPDVTVGVPTVPAAPDVPVVAPDAPTAPVLNPTPTTPSNDAAGSALIPTNVALDDFSGGDDDSPTAAESASLAGPFVKDISRSAGPPSVPRGLTLLLASDNWLEFTWAPSVDDQSVEAYEIYRDGQLIATIRGDTGYEHDYRNWLSTSFMDCNYTRFIYCNSIQPTPATSYSYSVAAIDNEGMRSERSTPVIFQTEQLSSSPIDLSDYTAVFTEEFNGSSLNRDHWKTSLPWGPDTTINAESQYFVNTFGNNPPAYDPFVFTGETLRITGIDTPAELRQAANNKPYLSGVITSSDHFEMTYGYVEVSARVASGEGLLSTFYLFNQNFDKNSPEIDVLEYIGSRPNKAYQTYHYYDSNRVRWATGEKHSTPTMETVSSEDLSSGFHTYAVLWEPGFVAWYVDGQEVRLLSGVRISDEPMNIIVQMVIGSEWIGSPAASSIPAVFEIDYIRAWQKQ
ncbi:MAG: beta-glucanase (GH16 family) [Patiriisocius sp.]|jgi:beta-glucanase (GH16 family)